MLRLPQLLGPLRLIAARHRHPDPINHGPDQASYARPQFSSSNMCFFDQQRFSCGDWKWGHFRQHCNREYRMGETCGMKLVMQTIQGPTKCKLCEKIDTKMRRRGAEVDRINRWNQEGSRFQASIEKSYEIIRSLDGEIYELGCERNRRLQGIGSSH